MATTLASQPCGKECTDDADFTVTFQINCITLTNEEKFSDDEKFLSITWDGNVLRIMAKESLESFKGPHTMRIHCSPMQLSRKLQSSPIFMNLMAFCEDLGTVKLPLTDCFCDAVQCNDFNSQVLKNDFKFEKDEVVHGTIELDFRIQRMDNQQNMFEAIKKSQLQASKKKRMKSKTQSDSDSDDENDALCRVEFPCPNDIPEYCKKHFDVDEHSYRIINGHLVNVSDKRGFCGDICGTAMKYCKELKKMPPTKVSSLDLQKLFKKKTENVPKIPAEVFNQISNLNFCKNVDKTASKNLTSSLENSEDKKGKKAKKKRSRKEKACTSKESIPTNDPCTIARNKFVKKMKENAVGKYSYDFGNSYPYHRSTCSLVNVCEKVPSHMGWRHDKVFEENQQKWQPGRINKIVRYLMKHFLRPYPYDTISTPKHPTRKFNQTDEYDKSFKPTLEVIKRDGEIIIQMNPLKDNKDLATDCNPYLNCSPLKFMIKRHPDDIKMHKARKLMKSRGFEKKCHCNDIKFCRCISSIRKEMFKDEMRKISRELKLKNGFHYQDVYDTSDSEIDFEFTPPSVLDSLYKCKPDVAHIGTQYDFRHFIVTKKEKSNFFCKREVSGCVDNLKNKALP